MEPQDALALPKEVFVSVGPTGELAVSPKLAGLLLSSREEYRWPSGVDAVHGQRSVLRLEEHVSGLLSQLSPAHARDILARVSDWGGNRAPAKRAIERADQAQQRAAFAALRSLVAAASETELIEALLSLCELDGVQLVMATKIFRFCMPDTGAAVDRHTSYFFNSLELLCDGGPRKATGFRREWSDGRRTTSRLAIYSPAYLRHACEEYVHAYLPMLARLAGAMNRSGRLFRCAATARACTWRPADVEMAAYHWWARNGPR